MQSGVSFAMASTPQGSNRKGEIRPLRGQTSRGVLPRISSGAIRSEARWASVAARVGHWKVPTACRLQIVDTAARRSALVGSAIAHLIQNGTHAVSIAILWPSHRYRDGGSLWQSARLRNEDSVSSVSSCSKILLTGGSVIAPNEPQRGAAATGTDAVLVNRR